MRSDSVFWRRWKHYGTGGHHAHQGYAKFDQYFPHELESGRFIGAADLHSDGAR